MNNNLKCALAFLLGGGTGAGIAYIFTKKKYESIIEVEVSSARESYNRLKSELAEKNEKEKMKMFSDYTEKVEQYINDAVEEKDPPVMAAEPSEDPYVQQRELQHKYLADDFTEDEYVMNNPKYDDTPVAPSTVNQTSINTPAISIYEIDSTEYGAIDDYKLVSLNYYTNGVVTDENDDMIEDPETILTQPMLDKLAIYEVNDIYTAYVRNDVRRCDYEIFITQSSYVE